MRLGDIYDAFIREGIKADLRSPQQIRRKLNETRQHYRKLAGIEKKLFDKESLKNPYSDTRVLFGNLNEKVKSVLIGIDIETAEILLADRLRSLGRRVDLIIAHHPEGIALAGLDDVMDLQALHLEKLGIPLKIGQNFMAKRIKEVSRRLHGSNHTRTVDAAKLLEVPLMCCHTPADNHVASYLQKKMDRKKPATLNAVVKLLLEEPEYQDAVMNKAGPQILVGKPEDKAGKIVVDMTGGTEGSKDLFGRLSQAGVTTLLGMHLSEEHYNRIKGEHIHVIIAGHMASDNLGMNLLLDKLEQKEKLEVIGCSGFRRVRRHGIYS